MRSRALTYRLLRALVLVCLVLLQGRRLLAQTLPPGFQLEEIIGSGLTAPTSLEFLPDGSMLIAEFGGTVRMVPPGGAAVNPTPVLTLPNMFHESISLGGERGLVGIVADPDFATNHFFYVFYTANTPQRDRVGRFVLNGVTADPLAELVIWQGVQDSTSPDHHGGGLAFGPDGRLYISTGDNGDPPSVQSLANDHGKILRVNANGSVPTDNPFHDGVGPHVDAIWALGLRNPYRISFDRLTGRLYIGDVGQSSFEEINLGVAGANYGWPTCEGPCSVSGMRNPIYSFSHDGRDSAVTGGFVYRGSQFPPAYQGVYFFGNYVQSWLRYLTLDANGNATGADFFQPADGTTPGPYGFPVCIKEGPDGALYYVDIGGDGTAEFTGTVGLPKVRRIRYVSENQPPSAVANAIPTSGLRPLTVSFSSAGSSDPEGQPLSFLWTFGDGATSTDPNPTHQYTTDGEYSARLSVSDGTSTTLGSTLLIRVGRPPVPIISGPAGGTTFRAGDLIAFAGDGSDPDDGALPASAFTWTVLFHHETHIHPGGTFSAVKSGTFTIPTSGHDFSGNTSYEIVLTVRDSSGLTSSTSVFITPQKVNLSFTSVPSGLTLTLDGVPSVTPFVKDALVNFQYTLDAPSQVSGGTSYVFTSWSDGGARTHPYTTPAAPQSIEAAFSVVQIPPGLVAAYGFDEGTGSTIADASGHGHVGTITGATWSPLGKFGNALSFNGSSSWVTVAATPLLNLTTAMTLEAWVFPTTAAGAEDVVIKEGSGVDIYNLYARNWRGLPEANAFIGGANVTSEGVALPPGVWTHLAATYDGGAVRLFVNGAQAASTAVAGPIATSTGALRIGGNSLWGEFFEGRIDEVRIYDRALTQAEIQSDLGQPLGPAPPDTTPPVRSNGQPSGTLAAGASPIVMSLVTDESAVCRFSTAAGVAFDAMTGVFSTTGATSHATPAPGTTSPGSYTFYVRCRDAAGNANTTDLAIAFAVVSVTTAAAFPSSTTVLTGTLNAGTAASLTADDNVYYAVNSTTTATRTAAWYGQFDAIPRALTRLLVSYKGNNSRNCTQTIALWNWTTSAWQALDSRTVGTTEIAIGNLAPGGTLAAYVSGSAAAGSLRVRVQCQANASLTNRGDTMSIVYDVPSGPPPPDTTPPVRSTGQPGGTLPAGTTQASISLVTDENASCRYATSPDVVFDAMPAAFTTTGGTAHATTVTGLANGGTYSFFVRCRDAAGNANTTDFPIAFAVAAPAADTTPPVRSNGQPGGTLPAGTTQVTLSLTTSENAACRYATTAGVSYASMAGAFATTGGTAHATVVSGLVAGTFAWYVRCQDVAGNANLDDFPISFAIATAAPPAGLVLAYGFNEPSGASALDASGNGLTGAITAATRTAAGKFGGALTFNGTNSWVTAASSALLNLTTGMTLEAWVMPTAHSANWNNVIIKERTSGEVYNLYSNTSANAPAAYVVRTTPTTPVEVRGTGQLPLGTWTHLAVTYDNATLRLYVNGVQAGSVAVTGALTSSTGALRIGGNAVWGEFFTGTIDEVRIYARALTAAEIQTDMVMPIVP